MINKIKINGTEHEIQDLHIKEDLVNLNDMKKEKNIHLDLIDGAVYWETGVITNEFGSRFKRTDYIDIYMVLKVLKTMYMVMVLPEQ